MKSVTQIGFVEFGGPHILSMLTEVATRALKAVWYQKWSVHRRLRPEVYGGRVHNHKTGAASYPLHQEILSVSRPRRGPSGARHVPPADGVPGRLADAPLVRRRARHGRGRVHDDGQGVLRRVFVLPNPVVPSPDGTALVPYAGPALTAGHELDKVAANVAIGRNAAGVHWRSDYTESLRLGEAVALTVLEEQKACYNETFRVDADEVRRDGRSRSD